MRCRSFLRIKSVDELVHFLEVGAVVPAHGVQRGDVQRGRLADYYQQNVLADLHLADKVLIVHHAHLEVLAVTQLIELSFEVIVELIHPASEAIEEVLVRFLLELKVRSDILVDLNIILEFTQDQTLDEGKLANVLKGLLL